MSLSLLNCKNELFIKNIQNCMKKKYSICFLGYKQFFTDNQITSQRRNVKKKCLPKIFLTNDHSTDLNVDSNIHFVYFLFVVEHNWAAMEHFGWIERLLCGCVNFTSERQHWKLYDLTSHQPYIVYVNWRNHTIIQAVDRSLLCSRQELYKDATTPNSIYPCNTDFCFNRQEWIHGMFTIKLYKRVHFQECFKIFHQQASAQIVW